MKDNKQKATDNFQQHSFKLLNTQTASKERKETEHILVQSDGCDRVIVRLFEEGEPYAYRSTQCNDRHCGTCLRTGGKPAQQPSQTEKLMEKIECVRHPLKTTQADSIDISVTQRK